MSIDILKDDLKVNKLKNIYLFYGPEEYLKKYYADSIKKALVDEGMKSLNCIVLEGKTDVRKISENCETMPVFADRKVVIVKNSGLFKSKKKVDEGETKSKAGNDDLTSYLQNIPNYACLVFIEEEIDKRIKAVDTIKKKGLLVEFAFQKPADLVKWAIKVFQSNKKDIDTLTVSQLVENCEQGMMEILNEIQKVILYAGERVKVTSADIEKVCTRSIKSRIFDLTDAVAERNASKAFKLLDEMVILKEPIPKILFMITRQLRHILEMKLLRNDGVSNDQAASRMGITPYAAGKVVRHIGAFSVETLKAAIEESLEMDRAIKTGKLNDRIAAELLIASFTKKV